MLQYPRKRFLMIYTDLFLGSWSMWRSGLIPTLLLWLLNGVIVAVVLARLFIFGEPVTYKNSEASTAYWRHRNQAEQDSARVNILFDEI
jgi:hypothetical protein